MSYMLLIRHGQNDWVKKNRLAGWTPGVHLNDAGQKQVEELGQRLAHMPIKAVYSSPLERCLETASAIAQPHQLDVLELAGVGEVRYGGWQGKKLKKLAKTREWYAVQHFPSRFRFPQGESFGEVQQRAITALEELNARHEKEVVAVVSHADVIKLVLAHYLGMHIDQFQRLGVAPASVSVLALSAAGGVRVVRVNDNGALTPPPPQEKHKDKSKRKKRSAKSGKKVSASSENERPAAATEAMMPEPQTAAETAKKEAS